MGNRELFKGLPALSVLGLRVCAPPMAPWPRFGEKCLYEVKRLNEAPTLSLVQAAVALGINFIDTDWASGNGHAEEIVGRALRGVSGVVISTKGGPRFDFSGRLIHDNSRANLMNQCEDSRQRLGVECVDLYSIHGHDEAVEIKQSARGMVDLAHNGRVKFLGAAHMPLSALEELAARMTISAVQAPFSLLERDCAIADFCAARGIAFLATDVLARGLLAGVFSGNEQFPEIDPQRAGPLFKPPVFERAAQFSATLNEFAQARGISREVFAIAWVLAQPHVSLALIEPKDESELNAWLQAAEVKLSDADLAAAASMLKQAAL